MKRKENLRIKHYLYWPLILGVILIIVNICIYFVNIKAGGILTAFTIIYIIISLINFLRIKKKVLSEVIQFANKYSKTQEKMLYDLSIPYGVMDYNGRIMWMNKEFISIIKCKNPENKKIYNFFSEITDNDYKFDEDTKNIEILYEDRNYRAQFKKITIENTEKDTFLNMPAGKNYFIALYLFDETEVKNMAKENIDQRFVAGLIYLDNYEEALESVEDVRQSLLVALIDRKINKYFQSIDGVVKKLEKDKYFIVFKQKHVSVLQSNKFSILDEVKTVNIGNEMPITISIGLGMNGESYPLSCEYSRTAIDLALGRGGDQAVIKDGNKIYYYGGKSRQVEKNTRVKARVKAHALEELLTSKDKVIIMGHKIGDIDSFGAAIGIYRVAKTLDKRVYIVRNEITSSVRPILERFVNETEYEEDMFVNNSEAINLIDDNTLLIVVDVNKPSYVECPELIPLSKTTVVLDHHRQGSEMIENAVLSYIEPYASSRCEMVAEILQYISVGVKLKKVEADALYAGIIIDTNYFTNKTGVRTFEAAAYLKRNGADVTKVRQLFRDDIEDYRARALTVFNSEIFLDNFVIGECPSHNIDSPTVVAAQAANEMLNINGIKASFVVTDYNDIIYISARSTEDINVQLVMERLGGGGHMNTAGAQLEDCTIDESKLIIKETITKMIEEGDL